MLYKRWREIAGARRDQIALRDLAGDRQWTFAELAEAGEMIPQKEQSVAFPRGSGAEFILAVIQAWHCGSVVCPLEIEQQVPELSAVLPADTVHLKTTS